MSAESKKYHCRFGTEKNGFIEFDFVAGDDILAMRTAQDVIRKVAADRNNYTLTIVEEKQP